jgi:hypothetical protein
MPKTIIKQTISSGSRIRSPLLGYEWQTDPALRHPFHASNRRDEA